MKRLLTLIFLQLFSLLLFPQFNYPYEFGLSPVSLSQGLSKSHNGDIIMTGNANIGGNTIDKGFITKFSIVGDSISSHIFNDTNMPNPRKFIYAGYSDFYISRGVYHMPNGDKNVGIMKTNLSGQVQWVREYGDTLDNVPTKLIATKDSGAIFSYFSESYNNITNSYEYKARLVKVNIDGDVLKYKNFYNSNFMFQHLYPLTENDTNYVVLAVGKYASTGNRSARVYRLNKNFTVMDSSIFNLNSEENPVDFMKSNDGSFYMPIVNGIIKLNSNLSIDFKASFATSNSTFDNLYKVIQLYDDNFAAVGRQFSSNNNYQTYVVKFDKNGDTIWTKKFGDIDFDSGYDILETGNHGLAICGTTQSDTGSTYLKRGFFILLNSLGNFSTTAENIKETSNIRVYPNPANDFVNFELNQSSNKNIIQIYSVDGKLIESKQIESNYKLDISDYKSGLYIYKIYTNHKIINGKLIKKN